MITCLLLSLAVAAADPDPYSLPGTFQAGERTVSVPRGDGTSVTSRIYYPATSAGLNKPVDASGGQYPVITFAHGFAVQPTVYASTLRHLASRGYLVIATTSQAGTFDPNRQKFVDDVRGTIDYMIAENTRAASPFLGLVNTTEIGSTGHSLGGGISIIEAAGDSRVKASATLAAATLRDAGPLGPAPPPYADADVANLNIPVSLINGSLDELIPVAANGQVIYDAASGPRQLPNLIGGYHSGFWDINAPFDEGTVTQEEELAFTRAELTSFFDLYLKHDQNAWRRQWGPERLAAAGVVDTQLDPGFTITPSALSLQSQPGNLVAFDLVVKNQTDHADSFTLFTEDNQWGVSFSTNHTPLLGPGELFSLQAFVNIPAELNTNSDRALISARSDLDGGTRAYSFLNTVTVPEPSGLFLAFAGLATLVGWRRRIA